MKTLLAWTAAAALALASLPAQAQDPAQDSPLADPARPYTALSAAAAGMDPGAGALATEKGTVYVNGAPYVRRDAQSVHSGVLAPDGRGGYVWLGADKPVAPPARDLEDARELRLRVRELASQLLEAGERLPGAVALPASFVHQDDFNQSSSFGRLVAELLFHELGRRGVPVREYRALPSISPREGGEFVLSRDPNLVLPLGPDAMVVTGTYYFDKRSVYVNARIFRAGDGMVLRTAGLVFSQNETTRTLLARGAGVNLRQAYTRFGSFAEAKDQGSLGLALMERDLH
ncbi:MAG: FlgO family outer membrane protein [Thermodesulfobacteriota bacterium]